MKVLILTQGQVALVSDRDYPRVRGYKWTAMRHRSNGFYAYRKDSTGRNIYLHREILKAPDGFEVDHKNGCKLDCRRNNIRLLALGKNRRGFLTPSKNKSSRFRGVSWFPARRKWVAKIQSIHVGIFSQEIDAARAYNRAAEKLGYFREAFNSI